MKGKTSKKPSVKRTAIKKDSAGPKNEHSEVKKLLLKELKKMIVDIDENGLKFLIKQAHILQHNMKVEHINSEIQKLTSGKGTENNKKTGVNKEKLTMEIVEADDNSSFIFVINRTRKIFTLEEMRNIVKICHNSKDENDAVRKLYSWFSNKRSDTLIDMGIAGATDPALHTIYNHIINTYTVKE